METGILNKRRHVVIALVGLIVGLIIIFQNAGCYQANRDRIYTTELNKLSTEYLHANEKLTNISQISDPGFIKIWINSYDRIITKAKNLDPPAIWQNTHNAFLVFLIHQQEALTKVKEFLEQGRRKEAYKAFRIYFDQCVRDLIGMIDTIPANRTKDIAALSAMKRKVEAWK